MGQCACLNFPGKNRRQPVKGVARRPLLVKLVTPTRNAR